MDQGIKSALDKYNLKLGLQATNSKSDLKNKIMFVAAIVIAVVLVFSVCVKSELLGADRVWNEIAEIDLGEKTVGAWLEEISKNVTTVFASDNQLESNVDENRE